MSIPNLDAFFRSLETRKLNEIFAFIVDNGPLEAPGGLLVQILLIRLLKFQIPWSWQSNTKICKLLE